jgi:hypothetical protein
MPESVPDRRDRRQEETASDQTVEMHQMRRLFRCLQVQGGGAGIKQARNLKFQNTKKCQIPKRKRELDHGDLFEIWDLLFGFFSSLGVRSALFGKQPLI